MERRRIEDEGKIVLHGNEGPVNVMGRISLGNPRPTLDGKIEINYVIKHDFSRNVFLERHYKETTTGKKMLGIESSIQLCEADFLKQGNRVYYSGKESSINERLLEESGTLVRKGWYIISDIKSVGSGSPEDPITNVLFSFDNLKTGLFLPKRFSHTEISYVWFSKYRIK